MSWPQVLFDSIIVDSAFGPRFSGDCYTEDGNVATLRTTDLSIDGVISLDTMPEANIEEEKFINHFLQIDDLVISRSGRIGTTAIFNGYHKPVLPGAFLIRFRLNMSKANPLFYRYFFNSIEGQQRLHSVARGAAQQNINITNVRNLHIPLPPPVTQKSIAGTLSSYDNFIENNRRRIQLLEESARLLYQEWFVHLRFPGHEQVTITDGVPDGWERKFLTEVAEVNRANLKKGFDERIEYIDISCVSTNSVDDTTWYEFIDAPGRARRIIQNCDILWSCVRPNRRSHALIWEPHDHLIASTGFAVITAMNISPFFLYQAVTTNEYVGYLTNRAGGAAYPAVTAKVFEESRILVSSEKLWRLYDEQVCEIHKQVSVLHQQNQKLAQARDILLPKLMSGELTV
jgi:type I restriction enzyme S subunit